MAAALNVDDAAEEISHKVLVEIERGVARLTQAKAVMPMIGPLLDAWDGIPNDVKSDEEMSELRKHLNAIAYAMEKPE